MKMDVPVTVAGEIDMASRETPLAEQTNAVVQTFPAPRRVQLPDKIEPIGHGYVIRFPFHADKFALFARIVCRRGGEAAGKRNP